MPTRQAHLHRLVSAALLSALCYAATRIIQIPAPMGGYVNLGDCIVLLSGWMLGPWWGFLAAGVGSMLADLLSGYAYYAPATFLIKGAMALLAALLFPPFKKLLRRSLPTRAVCALVCEAVMAAGYFGYAVLLSGSVPGSIATLPSNLIQGAFGVLTSILLAALLERTPLLRPTGLSSRN